MAALDNRSAIQRELEEVTAELEISVQELRDLVDDARRQRMKELGLREDHQ